MTALEYIPVSDELLNSVSNGWYHAPHDVLGPHIGTSTVTIRTIRRLADNSTRTEYWDARLTFHSDPGKEMSDTERELNPFGFTVTSWQADREIRGGE